MITKGAAAIKRQLLIFILSKQSFCKFLAIILRKPFPSLTAKFSMLFIAENSVKSLFSTIIIVLGHIPAGYSDLYHFRSPFTEKI